MGIIAYSMGSKRVAASTVCLAGLAFCIGFGYGQQAGALAGGPDAYGYQFTDSTEPGGPAYDFEDISTTGTAVFLGDDEVSGAIPIGFPFNYYGVDYTEVYISSNGFLTVLPGQSNGCCSGQPLPAGGDPNGVISGWWDDLLPPAGGSITYETLGSPPNRRFIVQFTDITHCCSGTLPCTLQYKIYEGSNAIEVHYNTAPADGTPHGAGIEDADGIAGLQYHLGTDSLSTPLAVQYFLISDDLEVTGGPLDSTGYYGGPFAPPSVTYTLTNNGGASLDWTASNSEAWLDLSSAGGTLGAGASTTVDVTINANANALVPNAYMDNVAFTNVTSGAIQYREVDLTVEEPIEIGPAIDFACSGYMGGPFTPGSIAYTGTNHASIPIDVTISWSAAWLDLSFLGIPLTPGPNSGTLPAGAWGAIDVVVNGDANSLPPGTYTADLIVTDDTTGVTQTRHVELEVLEPLEISPGDSLVSSGNPGGPFTPNSITYTLTNNGGASLDWTATRTEAWIDLSSAGGTLGAGASTTVDVTINAAANGLGLGVYADTVWFGNTTTGGSESRGVQLTVTPPQTVYVSGLPAEPADITIDQTTGTIYYAAKDDFYGSLYAIAPDRSVNLVTSDFASSLAEYYVQSDIQFYNDHVYTVLAFGHLVEIDPATGSSTSVLLSGYMFIGAGVDVRGGQFLLTDGGFGANILLGYDPVGMVEAVLVSGLPAESYGLEYDPYGDKVYFAESNSEFYRADIVGGTYTPITSGAYSGFGNFAVSPDGQYLYARVQDRVDQIVVADGTVNPFVSGCDSDDTDDVVCGPASSGSGDSLYVVNGYSIMEIALAPPDSLEVSPSSGLNSSGYYAGPFVPGSITYTLTNNDTAPVDWTASNSEAWLDLSSSGGTLAGGASTTVDVTFNANANTLLPSTYPDVVAFTNVTSGVTQNRPVDLVVLEPIEAVPLSGLTSGGYLGGPFTPGSITYTGTNHASVSIDVRISYSATWLDVYVWGILVPPGDTIRPVPGGASGPIQVVINANANSLPVATYIEDVVIADETTGVVQTRRVSLDVTEPFEVTPGDGLVSSGPPGGPFTPDMITYTLTNHGGVSVDWTATKTEAWIDLSSAGGTLGAGASTTVDVTINSAANAFAVGGYADTVWFADSTTGGGVSRGVQLWVRPPQTVYVSGLPEEPADITIDQATGTIYYAVAGDTLGTLYAIAPDRSVSLVASSFADALGGQYFFSDIQFYNGRVYTVLMLGELVEIDPASGVSVQIHTFTDTSYCAGLDVRAGEFLSTDGVGGGDALRSYNPTSMVESLLVDGLPVYSIGLEYNTNDDGVYVAAYPGLYRADIVGGTYTPINDSADSGAGNFAVSPEGQYLLARVADRVDQITVADGTVSTFSVGYANDNSDDIAFGPSSSGGGTSLYVVSGDSIFEIEFETDPLEVSPLEGLTSFGGEGGPFTPASITYTLTNNDADPLDWTAAPSTAWVDVSSTGGTLAGGASTTVDVSINASANGLGIGTWADSVVFTNVGTAVMYVRPVELSVGTPLDVTIEQAPAQVDPTDSLPIEFEVQFSEGVSGFTDTALPGGDVEFDGAAPVTGYTITPDGEPAPTSIDFEILNTSCSGYDEYAFYLNGGLLGTVQGDPGGTCTCDPPLQTYVVNDAGLIASLWNVGSPNELRVTKSPGYVANYFAWVRAQLHFASTTDTVCIHEYDGGNCSNPSLCGAGYGEEPFDESVVVTYGNPDRYTVSVTAVGGEGTVVPIIPAGAAQALAHPTLLNRESTSADNSVWYDTAVPTVDILDVAPDPRNLPVALISIVFSEPVVGFDTTDLTLTRDGGPDLLTGSEPLTTADDVTWTLGALSSLTDVDGTYTLTVAVSDIEDVVGRPLAGSANETWLMDTEAPTVDVVDVAPDPRRTPVNLVQIVFTEPVLHFGVADLRLTRDGGSNLLTGTESLVTSDSKTWALNTLVLTALGGSYTLAVNVSDITDQTGNPLEAGASDSWVMDLVAPTVTSVTPMGNANTNAAEVQFKVMFSESVAGVDTVAPFMDFALITGAKAVSGAAVTAVSGSGSMYTVTADTGSGDGALGLHVIANGTIHDAAGNVLTVGFTGETFSVDKTAPGIAIGAPSEESTTEGPVSYEVTYTGAHTITLSPTHVDLESEGTATGTVTVTGTGTSARTVNISDITGTGDVSILILPGTASDLAGNQAPAAGPSAPFTVETGLPTLGLFGFAALAGAVALAASRRLRRKH